MYSECPLKSLSSVDYNHFSKTFWCRIIWKQNKKKVNKFTMLKERVH